MLNLFKPKPIPNDKMLNMQPTYQTQQPSIQIPQPPPQYQAQPQQQPYIPTPPQEVEEIETYRRYDELEMLNARTLHEIKENTKYLIEIRDILQKISTKGQSQILKTY
jgi:hypothetical protein